LRGQRLRVLAQRVGIERLRRPELQAVRGSIASAGAAQKREQRGAKPDTLSSIDRNGYDP
jgi:hypothetical protein